MLIINQLLLQYYLFREDIKGTNDTYIKLENLLFTYPNRWELIFQNTMSEYISSLGQLGLNTGQVPYSILWSKLEVKN